jgi:hypothetical protein
MSTVPIDPTKSVGDAPSPEPSPEYKELWFRLSSRWPWSSLVLVPAAPDGTTEDVARALAEVGQRVCDIPVEVVAVNALKDGSAVALADLQERHWRRYGSARRAASVVPEDEDEDDPAAPDRDLARQERRASQAIVVPPTKRIILAIPPVVTEPLGLAAMQHADLVIVCVEAGRTRLAQAARTVELIGRERVSGCFLLR